VTEVELLRLRIRFYNRVLTRTTDPEKRAVVLRWIALAHHRLETLGENP
jgi:hypothetical protein